MTPKTKETTVLTSAPPIQNGFSLISNEKLLQLYVTTLKCRMIQERVRILVKQNKLIGHSLAAPSNRVSSASARRSAIFFHSEIIRDT